jgi:hypothetical protein
MVGIGPKLLDFWHLCLRLVAEDAATGFAEGVG